MKNLLRSMMFQTTWLHSCLVGLISLTLHLPIYAEGIKAANLDKIFKIPGYDNNDIVEIAAFGHLTNSCQKLYGSKSKLEQEQHKIALTVKIFVHQSRYCTPMNIPFLEMIQVGHLDEGQYHIYNAAFPNEESSLNVNKKSAESADDFHYAPVENIEVNSDLEIILHGTYPKVEGACLRIREVLYTQGEDVLVIKPITEMIDAVNCSELELNTRVFYFKTNKYARFSKPTLIHVRALSGKSINKVVHEY